MKRIDYLLLIALFLLLQPILLLAESPWPIISLEKDSKSQIVQLESDQKFKLQTLRQDSNPTKLIFIFETDTAWQAKELEVNHAGIARIDLKPLSTKEYSLEIQLSENAVPEFKLKNTLGNFSIIFGNILSSSNSTVILTPDEITSTPTTTTVQSLSLTEKVATKENEKELITEEVIAFNAQPNLEIEANPTISITEEITPTGVEKDVPTKVTTSPPIIEAKKESIITNTKLSPSNSTKNLTSMEYVNLSEEENYLLLGFAPKPNFSFTLKEQGLYELMIPEFKLSGQHLAQIFYAPQNSLGFLNVKAEQVESEDGTNLLIRIKVEPFFQLTFLPIPEGIKVIPSVSATK